MNEPTVSDAERERALANAMAIREQTIALGRVQVRRSKHAKGRSAGTTPAKPLTLATRSLLQRWEAGEPVSHNEARRLRRGGFLFAKQLTQFLATGRRGNFRVSG